MNIDEKNYEEFLIRHIENDLSANEREVLFAFLEKHPDYRRELELFELSRLVPDESVSFGDTSSLKRTATRFSLNNWLVWSSVAATILILIYFKFLSPGMTGVNSASVSQHSASNKSAQTIAANSSTGSSSVNASSNSKISPNSQKPELPVQVNQNAAIQSQENENNRVVAQVQNTSPVQSLNPVSRSTENSSVPVPDNSATQTSFSSNSQSVPVITVNAERENAGNVQLNAMHEIIPAVYVSRRREILVSKVPDVNYVQVASVVNQQSQQGDPLKDIASLFKAAVDHTPISKTSFYQHSSVGKLLATQVVYEHH